MINSTKTKSIGTEFLTETNTIEELKSFGWICVEEMFQENDKHQERKNRKRAKLIAGFTLRTEI
jgi:hypothetical protein